MTQRAADLLRESIVQPIDQVAHVGDAAAVQPSATTIPVEYFEVTGGGNDLVVLGRGSAQVVDSPTRRTSARFVA